MMNPPPRVAKNTRRAAALWCHHVNRDVTGMNAVLTEAMEDPDQDHAGPTQLILGLLTVFEALLPLVHSQAGVSMIRGLVADLSGIEDEQ